MNNPGSNKKLTNCTQHNQPILFYAPQNGAPLCQICIQVKDGLIPYDQFHNKLGELLIKGNNELEGFQQQLQQLLDLLLIHKQNIIAGIDKILKVIMDQIKSTKLSIVQLQNLIQPNIEQEQIIAIIQSELNKIENRSQQVKTEIRQQILSFQQKFNNVDYMLEMFKLNPKVFEIDTIAMPKKIAIQEVKRIEKKHFDRFEYKLTKEFTKKEGGFCHAFAFNIDNTRLLVGCEKQIIVYEFNNGKIQNELQRLSNHVYQVSCLYFMKQSNGFVSGSMDNSIIIWSNDKNNQWIAQYRLKNHEYWVYCLLMNYKEDLLISGSADWTIKIWRKNNDSWNCQQTINANNQVFALSLNEEENKLISCGYESKILIFEIQQSDQQWILAQTINVSRFGFRLSFTIGNQFVFQPQLLDYLEIYNYDNLKKQFSKITQVQVQKCNNCICYFPCQFIKQLNILTVKHGNFLNIFKVNQDGNYQLMQTIQYKCDYNLYARMTEDGKYLVTWDEGSKEIQVRQLKYVKNISKAKANLTNQIL